MMQFPITLHTHTVFALSICAMCGSLLPFCVFSIFFDFAWLLLIFLFVFLADNVPVLWFAGGHIALSTLIGHLIRSQF